MPKGHRTTALALAVIAAAPTSTAAATGTAAARATPATTASTTTTAATCPWVHSVAPAAARVRQVLGQMTLDDKLAMVDGVGFSFGTAGYVGHIAANPRLCIPGLNLEDGPQGVADGVPGVTQ